MSDPTPTWWSREHPLIVAAVQAEEAGQDPDGAVIAKASELEIPVDTRMMTLQRLHDAGYLDVAILRGDNRLYGAHVRKVTPKGVQAAGDKPPVASIEFVTAVEIQILEPMLAKVRAAIEESDLVGNDLADAEAQLDTAQAQLRSPRPRRRVLIETLKTLRSITENVVAAAIWVRLVEQLPWLQ